MKTHLALTAGNTCAGRPPRPLGRLQATPPGRARPCEPLSRPREPWARPLCETQGPRTAGTARHGRLAAPLGHARQGAAHSLPCPLGPGARTSRPRSWPLEQRRHGGGRAPGRPTVPQAAPPGPRAERHAVAPDRPWAPCRRHRAMATRCGAARPLGCRARRRRKPCAPGLSRPGWPRLSLGGARPWPAYAR